jgi:hypothetical protein
MVGMKWRTAQGNGSGGLRTVRGGRQSSDRCLSAARGEGRFFGRRGGLPSKMGVLSTRTWSGIFGGGRCVARLLREAYSVVNNV